MNVSRSTIRRWIERAAGLAKTFSEILVREVDAYAGLVKRRLRFRDVFQAFRPGALMGWIKDRARRIEWGMVSWSATLNGQCPYTRQVRGARTG